MNNISKLFFILLFFITTQTFSQNKLGHINSQVLLSLMPERDSIAKDLENYSKQLQDESLLLEKEYNTKLQEYVAKQKTMEEPIKANKEQELTDLQNRIQVFQQQARQNLEKKQNSLLSPLIEKANQAIQEVAAENKFHYIFDLSVGSIVYIADDSIDILPIVKEKLGL